jgi:hypothetical protein
VTTQTNPGARFFPQNARVTPPRIGPPFGRGQFVLANEVRRWLPSVFDGQSWKPGQFTVAVCTRTTHGGEQLQWRYYVLDRTAAEAFVKAANFSLRCTADMLDAKGQSVTTERFTPTCGDRVPWNASLLTLVGQGPGGPSTAVEVMNPPLMENYTVPHDKIHLTLIAPLFLWQDGARHAPTLTATRTVSLRQDEIRQVQKIKCWISCH